MLPVCQLQSCELWLVRKDISTSPAAVNGGTGGGYQAGAGGSAAGGASPKIFRVLVELSNGKMEYTGMLIEPTDTIGSILENFSVKKSIDYTLYSVCDASGLPLSLDMNPSELGIQEIYLKKIQKEAELPPKQSVLVVCEGFPSKRYPLKQPPLVTVASFLNDVGLESIPLEQLPQLRQALSQKYWLGIKEVGFVFPLEEDSVTTNLNLYQFVQTMLINGINIVLELGLPGTARPQQLLSADDLNRALVSEASVNDLISPSFTLCLSQCKEEINESRSLFARHALFLDAEEERKNAAEPGEDPNIALWKYYFSEEMEYVYMNQEPPLPEGTVVTLSVKLPTLSVVSFKCPESYFVKDVIAEVFERWSRADPSALSHDVSAYVLKASGLAEFVIPTDSDLNFLTLGAFDYVRLQHRRSTAIPLVLYDRSGLHSASKRDTEEQISMTSSILTKLLARDVWRRKNDRSAVMKFTELDRVFKIKVAGVSFADASKLDPKMAVYVSAGLYFGGALIAPPVYTTALHAKSLLASAAPSPWDRYLPFTIPTMNIPKEARLCFTVYGSSEWSDGQRVTKVGDKDTALGWVGIHVLDDFAELRTGEMAFKLWDGAENPIGPAVENTLSPNPPVIRVEFESNAKIVEFPSPEEFDAIPNKTVAFPMKRVDPKDTSTFVSAINKDPLYHLTPAEKTIIWSYREIIRDTVPKELSKVLKACDWSNPDCVREVHRLLKTWKPIPDTQSVLELLDAKFADEQVRAFAVSNIEKFSDAEISTYLLQLVQVLKYEPHHASPIAFFILKRALKNNNQIGQMLYWLLKSEMHDKTIYERYGVILEVYLRQSKGHRAEIKKQGALLEKLERVALKIKEIPPERRIGVLRDGLSQIEFPDTVQLPIDPRFCVTGLVVDKCKYMDSKKLPLWLAFKNAEPNAAPILVMFKCGDDLRQDIFTLQLIRIMDRIWKSQGLDMMLEPYKVVSTGDQVGMVEVVLDSVTTGKIMKTAGGTLGAMHDDCITQFIHEKNRTDAAFKQAQTVFMKSCAGYCVATYILGIGDRHSDNIMVKNTGALFHIDFGHFLGNFKKKFGVKRERAPFKFTPQFAHVMGGKGSPLYAEFEQMCCKLYASVRAQRNSHLLITLFGLMLSTGIPELTKEEDIEYLHNVFSFELDNLQADAKFVKLINESLSTKTTTLNDIIHAVAH